MDITSRQNLKVKNIRALKHRKHREKENAFVVEGIRHLGEAFTSGAVIHYILYNQNNFSSDFERNLLVKMEEAGIECYKTHPDIMQSLGEKKHSNRMIGVVENNIHTLDELDVSKMSLLVALDSPQDPGNIGTILRTIDAVGADGLVLLGNHVDPTHPSAIRASMGVCFWTPIFSADFDSFIMKVKSSHQIIGSSAKADKFSTEITYPESMVLLMGSEREGLSKEQQRSCDIFIKLPMEGSASSLNLSVATGVLLYQIYNQKNK